MKIAIVQIYDNNIKEYAEYSRLMNAMYAHEKGYTYICFEYDLVPPSISVYYNKIIAIDSVLKDQRNFDYVLYLDSDALITNFKYNIEDIVQQHEDKDIIMASDDNGANNGVILLKNSGRSIEFLQKSFTNRNFFHSKTPEQNAMFYYLQGEFANDLGVEPSGFFNAYLDGYEDFTAPKDKITNWNQDSFILHLMTLSSEDRCNIFREILAKENIICMVQPKSSTRIAKETKK